MWIIRLYAIRTSVQILSFFHYQKKNVPKEHYFMKISECAMCLRKKPFLFYYFTSSLVLPRKTNRVREEELANKITFSCLDRWMLACLQSNLKF